MREAGGYVTAPDGGDGYAQESLVAANPALHAKLRELVADSVEAVRQRGAAGAG